MPQVPCPGCRQPLADQSSDCGYCRPLRGRPYVGRHLADRQVWCTGDQRFVAVAWVGAGQAFLCDCAKVHEVVECGGCRKAWGTAVNSFGELDRSGMRRCGSCRIPTRDELAEPAPCTLCGPSARHPSRRSHLVLGWLRSRRRKALECLECRAPVGWWQARKQRTERRSLGVAEPAAEDPGPEWVESPSRWNVHGDEDELIPGNPDTVGESAAA